MLSQTRDASVVLSNYNNRLWAIILYNIIWVIKKCALRLTNIVLNYESININLKMILYQQCDKHQHFTEKKLVCTYVIY